MTEGTEDIQAIVNDLKYYCTLRLSKYDRPQPFSKPVWNTEHVIRLPLPAELADQTAVKYNGIELELVGDIANGSGVGGISAQALRSSGDMAATGLKMGAGALKGMVGNGMMGQIVGKVADSAVDALKPDQIASAVQQGLGMAPNPNPSVAFTGPELQTKSLTWTFMPANAKESAQVKSIIEVLKRRALPANSMGGSASVLDYPYLCQMNFFPWDAANFEGKAQFSAGGDGANPWGWTDKSIIKIKRCFMASVNVNYGMGLAHAFFAGDNRPAIIQLSINFMEVEYLLASDWGGDEVSTLLGAIGDKVKGSIDSITTKLTSFSDSEPEPADGGDTGQTDDTKDAAAT